MNSDSLEGKSPELRALVESVIRALSPLPMEIVDDWPTDLMATGLANQGDGSRVAYVAILFDREGDVLMEEARYAYELECRRPRPGPDELPYHVAGSADGVEYGELLRAIECFLSGT